MNGLKRDSAFEPFFLPAQQGDRFCIFHPAQGVSRGSIVYVHPFAEEMNKSRRMAALQSRALAATGYGVLQIDLYGCGDSSGDFEEAAWEVWRQDVVLASRWLSDRTQGKVSLWGLRLGALLVLDAAPLCESLSNEFLLWQPVVTGEAVLNQFLRLRMASEMLAEGTAKTGVQDLRAALAAGSSVEIAGYTISAPLALPLVNLKLIDLAPKNGVVHWLEVVPEQGRPLPPASQRVADAWRSSGVRLDSECVPGQQFWNTVEITDAPELIAATVNVMADGRR